MDKKIKVAPFTIQRAVSDVGNNAVIDKLHRKADSSGWSEISYGVVLQTVHQSLRLSIVNKFSFKSESSKCLYESKQMNVY